MAYRCSFLDNEVYSASDVNNVFACLTSGGVTFSDSGNALSDLNSAANQTVSAGVTADGTSCKVVKDGDGYKISTGACFMNDGSVIIFDEDGQDIDVTPEILNYVYINRNSATNSIDIMVTPYQGGSDSVPLAQIDESGNITDKRQYAMSKVMLGVGNTLKNFRLEFTDCTFDGSETMTLDIGDGSFSYIIIWGGSYTSAEGTIEERVSAGRNLMALSEEAKYLYIGKYEASPKEFVYAKRDGQTVEVYLKNTSSRGKYTLNIGII